VYFIKYTTVVTREITRVAILRFVQLNYMSLQCYTELPFLVAASNKKLSGKEQMSVIELRSL